MALRTPSVLVSTSNEFDNLARFMHHVELNQQQQQLLMQSAASSVIQVQHSPISDTDETPTQQLKHVDDD